MKDGAGEKPAHVRRNASKSRLPAIGFCGETVRVIACPMALAYRPTNERIKLDRHLRRTVYQTCKTGKIPVFVSAVVSIIDRRRGRNRQ